MDAALRFPAKAPNLAACASVRGPGVIGDGEIENAVRFQRRRLDLLLRRALWGEARRPDQREVLDVGRVDLFERTMTATGIIAVIHRPAGILRRRQRGREEEQITELHWRFARYASRLCISASVYLRSRSWCAA